MALTQTHRGGMAAGLIMAAAGLVLAAGCAETGKQHVAFAGKCVDTKGKGVSAFTLSLARGTTPAASAMVTTAEGGAYETRVAVAVPPQTPASETLGGPDEKVTLRVTATGHKGKSFTVTADRIFTGKPNNLNITLEPSS